MNYKKFQELYQPYKNPSNFLDCEYNQVINQILSSETREEVMQYYKIMNRILNDWNFWGNIHHSAFYFYNNLDDTSEKGFEIYAFHQETLWNVRHAVSNRLLQIDKYAPYKEIVLNKRKEIIEYFQEGNLYDWNFLKSEYPSIHNEISFYLNCKIYNNDEIYYSDYFFLFPTINITTFGYDNIYDVTNELANIIEIKQRSPSALITEIHKTFNRDNSRYSRTFDLPKRIEEEMAPTIEKYEELVRPRTVEEISTYIENSYSKEDFLPELTKEQYERLNRKTIKISGVNFFKIKKLQNIIDGYYRLAENNVRNKRTLPAVNEGWISETNLFYEIKKHLKPLRVIQHARLKFLGKLHLDIFIPYLGTAIEYQGKQHFEPVVFFGGKKTFVQTVERDKRKKDLCERNGIKMIYVLENYSLEDVLRQLDEIRYSV